MSIYKRGNVYWYDFTVAGARFRGSTEQSAKDPAKDVEAALRTEAKQNAGLLPRKAPRLVEFIPNFKAWNEDREAAGKLKPRTRRYYERGCVVLEATPLARMALDRITPEEVEAVEFPGSNPYKNQAIRTLHRLMTLAQSKHIVRVLPRFHLFPEQGREAVIGKDTEDAVMPKCSKAVRLAVWVMKDSGLRRDEAARMRVEWIDWQAQVINVPDGKTKNARRVCPMSERVFDALFVRIGELEAKAKKKGVEFSGFVFPAKGKKCKNGHIHPDSLTRGFSRARSDAGIANDVVLYSARHTFGTDLADAVGNLKLVAKAMGHSSTRVTERYVHPKHIDVVRQIINDRNKRDGEKEATRQ